MPTDTYSSATGLADGYWHDITFDASGDILRVGYSNDGGNNRRSFLRFAGVTIPSGKVIDLAELDVVDWWTDAGVAPVTFRFAAEDAANPSAPTNQTDGTTRFSSPGLTSATGSNSSIGAGGQTDGTVRTLTVTAIVSELYASYSYAAGAAMQFFLYENASPVDGKYALFAASEHADAAHRPVLRITYSDASGAPVAKSANDAQGIAAAENASAQTVTVLTAALPFDVTTDAVLLIALEGGATTTPGAADAQGIAAAESALVAVAMTAADAQGIASASTAGTATAITLPPLMLPPLGAVVSDGGRRGVIVADGGTRAAAVTDPGLRAAAVTDPGTRGAVLGAERGLRGATVRDPGVRGATVTDPGVRGATVIPG